MELLDGDLRVACLDAGLSEDAVRLYRFTKPHDVRGSFLPPRVSLGLHPYLTPADAADAATNVQSYRVAVLDCSEVPFAALFRHELEHCAQWPICGPALFSITTALDDAFILRHGAVRGVYHLRYLVPMESDANAAASRFARTRFGDDACDALASTLHDLLVAPGAEEPDRNTLGDRQGCFAAVLGDALIDALRSDPRPLLAGLGPNATVAWDAARSDDLVREHADQAVAATPSAAATRAADLDALAKLWAPALAATERAYARAKAVNGL